MSIILASIDLSGKNVFIGTDRKAFSIRTGLPLKDEVLKLYKIRENLFFAGNGVDNIIYQVKDSLKKNKFSLTQILIDSLDTIKIKTLKIKEKVLGDCVFVLCGLNEEGAPFIYIRDTKTDQKHLLTHKPGRIIYALATFDEAVAKDLHSFFPAEYNFTNDCKIAIERTLNRGGGLCDTIGKAFDIESTQN